MPTPAERRALLFLGGLIIMGGGVRAVRATGTAAPGPDSASLAALDRQLAAVDSARAAKGIGGGRRTRSGGGRRGRRVAADTGDSGPRDGRRKSRQGKSGSPAAGVAAGSGVASEPEPRPQVYYLAPTRERAGGGGRTTGAPGGHGTRLAPGQRVDLDRAPAAELERLPRVGPVLARRIVANRDSLGPFGSLQAFRRVRGVGPAMLRILAPYVTFSTPPRQSGVVNGGGNRPRSRRRTGRAQPP